MAETYSIIGSQESLPLSEESCRLLLQELEDPLRNIVNDGTVTDVMSNTEAYSNVGTVTDVMSNTEAYSNVVNPNEWSGWGMIPNNPPEPRHPPASLPASESWSGDFSFNVSFKLQENTKGATWIYSKEKNKLYVGKDVSCPVNFSTSTVMPEDVIIRAMALFSLQDHACEVVTRCVNHSLDELKGGINEAEHFVRCESKMALYDNNSVTGRHSVVVPYENPAEGQQFSTYLYKFMCFGSCAGGPNRRPLMLIFTLERGDRVIGRQKIHLKVCACPARDFKNDDKLLKDPQNKEVEKIEKPRKRPIDDISDITPEVFLNPSKKMKERKEPYIIKVHDRKCYEFLKEMKRYFQLYTVKKQYPNLCNEVYIPKYLQFWSSQSEDDSV